MQRRHIAFIVESAHGHINPTLSIASNLVKRGHYVTHAIKDSFAPRVLASGSEPVLYRPLENKLNVFRKMANDRTGRAFTFDFGDSYVKELEELWRKESEDSLSQLEHLYESRKPDLIIYDKNNMAGKSLASKWRIPAVEHAPMMIVGGSANYEENLVIVSLPMFLQTNLKELDKRFQFVGPVFNDEQFTVPWEVRNPNETLVLVSATTGLLPQVEYFLTAIHAFKNLPWTVVLSIGTGIESSQLDPLPENFVLNKSSSQSDILKQASLFVGQGGPLSALEALRCGVPVILLPPSQVHDMYASRFAELGFGIRLPPNATAAELRDTAESLLKNTEILNQVKHLQSELLAHNGAHMASELIDGFLADKPISLPWCSFSCNPIA